VVFVSGILFDSLCHGGESGATSPVRPAFLHAWRSRSWPGAGSLRGADQRRPCHSSVTTGHESARRRRRAPVDAPRPVSERKPRSRLIRVSALGADHENRQRGKNVGVEEAQIRPPEGRRWQPPHVNTAGVAFARAKATPWGY